jgi:hypothetical protein
MIKGAMTMKFSRAAVALALSIAAAHAEPYLAARTGFKCSQCHLNKVGGGGRTEYGQAYTQYKLLMSQSQEWVRGSRSEGVSSFDPKLNDAVTIGANFRAEQSAFLKNGSAASKNELGIAEANLYVNVELVKNFLSLYIDQTMAPASANREMWVMARNLPANSYVRVGNTLLPYGLRLTDDQAFIRANTNYTYSNPAVAGEIGIEPGPVSFIANLSNTRLSTIGSYVHRRFRVGGSYSTDVKGAANQTFVTYGPFATANFGRFTMLGEVDFIKKANTADTLPDIKQVAHFYELNFLAMQGVNLKGTYEYLDRNTAVANKHDGQDRMTFGIETFPIQHLQLALYYRLNRFVPDNDSKNQDMLLGRTQIFF